MFLASEECEAHKTLAQTDEERSLQIAHRQAIQTCGDIYYPFASSHEVMSQVLKLAAKYQSKGTDEADPLRNVKQHASSHEDPDVRRRAVEVLARDGKEDPEACEILRERASSDEKSAVRVAALKGLLQGWKEEPETFRILEKLASSDESSRVRRAAMQELAKFRNRTQKP